MAGKLTYLSHNIIFKYPQFSILWITGGYENVAKRLDRDLHFVISTQIIAVSVNPADGIVSTTKLPNTSLPIPMARHCLVKIDEDKLFVFGGVSGQFENIMGIWVGTNEPKKQTVAAGLISDPHMPNIRSFIYSFTSNSWQEVIESNPCHREQDIISSECFPNDHSCSAMATMKVPCEVMNKHFIVVASARPYSGIPCTAILNLNTLKWHQMENDTRETSLYWPDLIRWKT